MQLHITRAEYTLIRKGLSELEAKRLEVLFFRESARESAKQIRALLQKLHNQCRG